MNDLEVMAVMGILKIFRAADEAGAAILPDATPRERLLHFYAEGVVINEGLPGFQHVDPEAAMDEVVAIATKLLMADDIPEEYVEDIAWIANNLSKYELS